MHPTRAHLRYATSRGRLAAICLTVAAAAWVVIVVSSPVALSRATLTAPTAVVYAAASRICHQRTERSFAIAGVQMPVCARCFGLYLSAALGAMIAWTGRRRPGVAPRTALALAAVPTAATWLLEFAGVSGFSNAIRATAALPLGLTAGWLLVQMLRYDFQLNGDEIHDRGPRVRVG